jgi:1-acyl-sn-glycerol-3-phosphate acyltransferase
LIWLRLFFGLIVAALFLAIFGPARRLAQISGWRLGRTLTVAFHRLLCFTIDARLRLHGAPSLAPRRLIVSNHVSWLDIPLLGAIEPMTFLAKKEVGGAFLGRQAALLQGIVFVDRQRKRGLPEVNANMARAMRAREPVLLFAEATTSDGNRLLRFRSSHFEAIWQARADGAAGLGDAVVQPVFLHYSGLAGLPVARIDRPIVAWYGDMTFLPHLWRFLRAGGATCEVYYGDPIPVQAAADRKLLARETERAVRHLAERARMGGSGATSAIPAEPKTG